MSQNGYSEQANRNLHRYINRPRTKGVFGVGRNGDRQQRTPTNIVGNDKETIRVNDDFNQKEETVKDNSFIPEEAKPDWYKLTETSTDEGEQINEIPNPNRWLEASTSFQSEYRNFSF